MDAAAKQQIVERIKQANNVLVTVSNNPSVDQLAACIGLTLMLNKMQKHATAVFSGAVPSTIEFLQPEKTLETNTDSLRDFIISLDKSKADKLRYKIEDQVVRIFITPYRSKISQQDLVFSEGDFNVEVVLALGVQDRAQIDAAITAHGRILHDATVISVNAGNGQATTMGQINWQEPTASSLSEMIVSISEAFGTGLIDSQMATAFLTGIVAQTDRFSNDRTTPRVMTMSAQLMAAGANQQLIATKLDESETPVKIPQGPLKDALDKAADTGVLSIPHEEKKAPVAKQPGLGEIKIDEKGNLMADEKPKAPVQSPAPPKPAPVPAKKISPPSPPPPKPPQAPRPPILPPVDIPPPPPPPPPPPKAEPFVPARAEPPPPKIEFSPPPLKIEQPAPLPMVPQSPAPTSSRTYLDTSLYQPAMSSSFSSTIEPTSKPVLGGVDSSESAGGSPGDDLFGGSIASAATPPPTVDNARNAVASAIQSAPFDPAFDRVTSLGAQEVNLDIHPETAGTPAPANGTPSLQLPMNGANPLPAPADSDNPAPALDTARGKPPTGPPPLMPAPGATPPTT